MKTNYLHKRKTAFRCAFKGIFYALKNEAHFKIHFVIMLIVIVLGFMLKISAPEWIACLLCIGLVLAAELINTAIEKTVDVASPEWNERAGIAKDAAAGATLVCAVISVIVGVIIFLPKILKLF